MLVIVYFCMAYLGTTVPARVLRALFGLRARSVARVLLFFALALVGLGVIVGIADGSVLTALSFGGVSAVAAAGSWLAWWEFRNEPGRDVSLDGPGLSRSAD